MNRWVYAFFAFIAVSPGSVSSATQAAQESNGCLDLLQAPEAPKTRASRGASINDLTSLRDIGPPNNELSDRRLFSISPDGQEIALQVRRARPESNDYCLGIVIVSSRGRRSRLIDVGGDLVRADSRGFDNAAGKGGIPEVITPQWSHDGRWVAFLKREANVTQVWRANTDGSGSRPLTSSPIDVERFALGGDDQELIFATRPDLVRLQTAIDHESRHGYHFDQRFVPTDGSRPQLISDGSLEFQTLNLATHQGRRSTPQERLAAQSFSTKTALPSGSIPTSDGGPATWVEVDGSGALLPNTRLKYSDGHGSNLTCQDSRCLNPQASPWLLGDGTVLFLKRDGWGNGETTAYFWEPHSGVIRLAFHTTDYLADCEARQLRLFCLRESPNSPRHLDGIDLRSGVSTTLYDPNPEWRAFRPVRVERINVRNSFGKDSYADFVYPAGYRAGQSYPTVVVQYVSRGFLRGGTGDENPIIPLANSGFAVLSVNRPMAVGFDGGGKTEIEVDRANLNSFADRRSVLEAIEGPLRRLIERGIVDPKRIGISGLSDGSSTVQFAAVNSSMFAAGIVSSCCWERMSGTLIGPTVEHLYRAIGYPSPSAPAPDFWASISLAQNADHVHFPILFEQADTEYLGALESFTALKDARVPVDMFVFPDEFHVKWQPAHRRAIYQRSLDWFNFWLKGEIPADGRRRSEVQHWQDMRDSRETSIGSKTQLGL